MYPRMPRTRYLDDAPDNASRIKLGARLYTVPFTVIDFHRPAIADHPHAAAETSAKAVSSDFGKNLNRVVWWRTTFIAMES